MAKKRNGSGEVRDLTVESLKSIRDEIRGLREETRTGFRAVNDRIDNLLDFSGARWRDHEERLRRLEKRR